jgi:acetylornithine aminotransferase
MTLAKPLAGGLPIGATLLMERVAAAVHVGDHGSTFAGGPLVCRAAQVVFDRIREPGFLAAVSAKGEHIRDILQALPSRAVRQIRGVGLMWGIEFDRPVKPLVEAALGAGLVVLSAGEHVIRLLPPLIITQAQIDEGLATLSECLPVLEQGANG